METRYELDQRIERARLLKAQAATPQHAACEAAVDADGEEGQAEEVRQRVQHQADPVLPDIPEVDVADLGKRFSQAFDTPSGYPAPGRVNPEAFRRAPIVAGEAAYAPDYTPSATPVPVPSGTLNAAAITRPLITSGQSRPSAEGC